MLVAIGLLFLGAPPSARAQSSTAGAVGGVITDPSHAVIVGARVTATSVSTNASASAKTDSTGHFLITPLQPGTYKLQITAPGFGAVTVNDVVAEVGVVTTADEELQLARQAQTVSVTATAPVVNTTQNAVATNFNEKALRNLPINQRRWSYFALSTPTAVPDGTYGDISFRGLGYIFDNNTVDGASDTQAFFAEETGRTRMAYSTSLNSVKEFQVKSANYSAEYGNAAGGVINAVTKSGSNHVHGDLYYYLRDNSIGGAYRPFATGAVQQADGSYAIEPINPTDIRDQFGGDAGGYIIKNKLFWYFSFDGFVHHFPITDIPSEPNNFFAPVMVSAPSSCAKATLSGSNAPQSLTTGQILYCRGFNQSQVNQALSFLDSTTGTAPRTGDQTIYFPKLDWHPNDKNTITVSYNRVRWTSPYGVQTSSVVSRAIDSNGNDYVHDDRAIADWTTVIGASMTNELRYAFSRDNEFEFATAALPGEPVSPITNLSPQVGIGGCGFSGGSRLSCSWTFGAPYYLQRPAYPLEKTNQVSDTFSLVRGNHFIKFGVDVIPVNDIVSSYASGDQLGEYYYSYLQDFLSDYITAVDHLGNGACTSTSGGTTYQIPCYNDYYQTFGPLKFNFSTVGTGAFVQDDWHLTPRLTFNLGLRWDREGLPSTIVPNPAIPQTMSFNADNKDFQPRVGFAWDPTGHGTTVIRGGYGMYYGRITNEQIYEQLSLTGSPNGQISATIYPTTGYSNATGTPTPDAPMYPNILASYSPKVGRPNVVFFPSDLRLPGAEEFDVAFQHQIARNTAMTLSYVGSIGRFLPVGIDTNLPQATTLAYTVVGGPLNGETINYPFFSGYRPNGNYNKMVEYCSCATSHYNAFVAEVNRRFTAGLQFNASYTYSHATDDEGTAYAAVTGNGPIDPYNLGLEEGTSGLNIPNRFIATVVWQPPYYTHSSNMFARELLSSWTLSLSQVAQTGSTFSGTISGNEPYGLDATVSSGGPTGGGTSTRALFLPKNGYTLPATVNSDVMLARSFHIRENARIQFSVQAFNLFNHVNYFGTSTTAYTIGGSAANPELIYNTEFNTPALFTYANDSVFYSQRQLQFGAKISF
jgi:hypothetical protein